jgi:hypothetical protein
MHDTNRPTGHHAQVARKPQQYRGGSFIEIGTPSSVARVSGPLVGEESDSYPAVASLNARWRIIACTNSIQWILQQRRGGDRWRGRYFYRTREALVRGAREHAGQVGGDALVVLLRLPERFPEAAQ